MVKSTGLHKYVDPENRGDTYFAIAVSVIPYPSGFYSVWTYVLLLVPNRTLGAPNFAR